MFWVDVLFALSMALIFTMIFAAGLRRTGPWSSVAVFFLVIFLAAWAGGGFGSARPDPSFPAFTGCRFCWWPSSSLCYWRPVRLAGRRM